MIQYAIGRIQSFVAAVSSWLTRRDKRGGLVDFLAHAYAFTHGLLARVRAQASLARALAGLIACWLSRDLFAAGTPHGLVLWLII